MAAYYKGDLNDNDIYYLELARITEEDLQTLDTDLRKAYVVKQAMDMPSSGQTKIIKKRCYRGGSGVFNRTHGRISRL